MSRFILTEGPAPGTPPTGKVYVYAKADGYLYSKDDAGVESAFNPNSLLADGTTPLTADWDVGAFIITALRLISDIATGTAPFQVASTTKVANLNADLLDDLEAAAFATAAQGTLADSAIQQAALDAAVAGLYDHKGGYAADTNTPDLDTTPSGILKGDAYTVTVAGTFYAVVLEAGDVLIADQDDPTLSTHWTIVNRNIDSSAFATSAQGSTADTAVQPGDAEHNSFSDYVADEHLPSATFATAAQGGTADTAVQPGDAAHNGFSDYVADEHVASATFATAAQGTLADSAIQQAALDAAVAGLYDHKGAYNASTNSPDLDTAPSGILKGDAYTVSVAGTFYAVVMEAGDVLIADQDSPTASTHWTIVNRNIDSSAFATAAQGSTADSAVQPGSAEHDNFSDYVPDEHLPSSTFATAAQGALADTAIQPLVADWDVGNFDLRSKSVHQDAGAATAVVAQRLGASPTEGYTIMVIDETVSALAAISTDLTQDIPDGSLLLSIQGNIETLVVAGGTSVKVGIGPVADPDKYGITSAFTQNLKIDTIPAHAVLVGAEDVQINMCATGGAIGDTVASAGAVRVRIVYAVLDSLDNA